MVLLFMSGESLGRVKFRDTYTCKLDKQRHFYIQWHVCKQELDTDSRLWFIEGAIPGSGGGGGEGETMSCLQRLISPGGEAQHMHVGQLVAKHMYGKKGGNMACSIHKT